MPENYFTGNLLAWRESSANFQYDGQGFSMAHKLGINRGSRPKGMKNTTGAHHARKMRSSAWIKQLPLYNANFPDERDLNPKYLAVPSTVQ